MPRVPQYRPNQVQTERTPTPNFDVGAGPREFGAAVGAGLTNVAGAVNHVARKEIAEANKVAVLSAETELNNWMSQSLFHPETGAFTLKGKDTFGLNGTLLPEFDKVATRASSNLARPEQRQAFQAIINERRRLYDQKLNEHEMSERSAYYNSEGESALKTSLGMVGNFYNDPTVIGREIAKQHDIITDLGARNGWSPDDVSNRKLQTESSSHTQVLERMISIKDIGSARSYLGAVRDRMLADDVTRVLRALQVDATESRAQLRSHMQDIVAAAKAGVPINDIPSRQVLMSAFGPEEGAELYHDMQAYAGLSRTISTMHGQSNQQLAETVSSYMPTQVEGAATQSTLASIVYQEAQSIAREREQDFGGYLLRQDPKAAQLWQGLFNGDTKPNAFFAFMDERAKDLGVSTRPTLPKAYQDQLVASITNPTENENLFGMIAQESNRWGEHWPRVLREVESKLPSTVAVIGSGVPEKAGVALSSMAMLKPDELNALVPKGQTMKNVHELVNNQMRPFLNSFPPDVQGTRWRDNLHDSAVRLTLYYHQHGQPLSQAVKSAKADLADSQYTVREFRKVPFRVPKQYDPELVQAGANRVLREINLTPSSNYLKTIGSRFNEEELTSLVNPWVRENGYWMTKPDGTGLRLYMDGAPVTNNRGPVDVSWEDLTSMETTFRTKLKQTNPGRKYDPVK